MYDTLLELWANTEHDVLANFLDMYQGEICDPEEEDWQEEIYGICQAYLMGHLSRGIDPEKIVSWVAPSCAARLLAGLTGADKEGAEVANNLMHLMHKGNPGLREEATFYYVDHILPALGIESPVGRTSVWYDGIVLTGKDSVPEAWEKVIRETALTFGCFCTIRMSWAYSHIDCGWAYRYDQPEAIDVEIYGDSREAVDAATEAVERLRFEWKEERK